MQKHMNKRKISTPVIRLLLLLSVIGATVLIGLTTRQGRSDLEKDRRDDRPSPCPKHGQKIVWSRIAKVSTNCKKGRCARSEHDNDIPRQHSPTQHRTKD